MSITDDKSDFDCEWDGDFGEALVQRVPWLETPLKAGTDSIRILKLHKGSGEDQICCNLVVASLDENPIFETLSYVWGDPTQTRTILVDGVAFAATVNLVDFLHHLRLKEVERFIWADALCIDQSSEQEKAHQLRLMTRIYRQGENAHIWFGAFTSSWIDEIRCHTNEFAKSSEMTEEAWEEAESLGQKELQFFLAAGGAAPDRDQYVRTRSTSWERVFLDALAVLDGAAMGKKLHEYPLYLCHREEYLLNRHWVTIMDCIRWIITRPWWSRVWTYQEVILPPRDSIVWTTRHSFAISRLLDGISALMEQYFEFKRAIKHNLIFWASYQRFPIEEFIRIDSIHAQRKDFLRRAGTDKQGLSLSSSLHSTQYRRASDARDHFFGLFGVLSPALQQWWSDRAAYGFSREACQIFAQCTRIAYQEYVPASLGALSEAVGLRSTGILSLPSWALDLSSPLPRTEERDGRWKLYNTCLGAAYQPPRSPTEFLSRELKVEGILIGAVGSCTPSHVEAPFQFKSQVLELVEEWRQVYQQSTRYASDAKFWRTAFMDRDIWRHWKHKRRPLYAKRIKDITAWWNHVCETGGEHWDLALDGLHNDGRRGDFHFRALEMNARVQRFFVTQRFEPGLGPHLLQPDDQIYILKGCNAPAMLRRSDSGEDGVERFNFVGSCFVDGHMYGETLQRHARWRDLILV